MKGINIAEYVYGNYTKGEFPRVEVEMALAQRAEAAILARDLKRLFEKPLEVYHYSGKYCYEPEKLEGHFCRLGVERFVKKIIDEINRLRGEGVLEPMIAEVFPDNEEARVELLARVAMALKTENFQFLYGNYGKLREKELQERLVKCGVVGYVYLNAQR
jgi:hypothetical protein